jgi:hypothetical protein
MASTLATAAAGAAGRGEVVGLILCVDELSGLKAMHEEAFLGVLKALMAFAHESLAAGRGVAVIGTTDSAADIEQVVGKDLGRCFHPIEFPFASPEMETFAYQSVRSNTSWFDKGVATPYTDWQVRGALRWYAHAGTVQVWEHVPGLAPTSATAYREPTA